MGKIFGEFPRKNPNKLMRINRKAINSRYWVVKDMGQPRKNFRKFPEIYWYYLYKNKNGILKNFKFLEMILLTQLYNMTKNSGKSYYLYKNKSWILENFKLLEMVLLIQVNIVTKKFWKVILFIQSPWHPEIKTARQAVTYGNLLVQET